jgi:hypothetical protein
MAKRKSFCLVGPRVTEESILSCQSGTHAHISWKELNLMHDEGEIEPIGVDPSLKKTELEPDYVMKWLIIGRVLQFVRHVPARGLSSKFGAYVAAALEKKKPWAKVFVAEIRGELEVGPRA